MKRALIVLVVALAAYEGLLHTLAAARVPPALLSSGSNAALAYVAALVLLVALRVLLFVLAPPVLVALLIRRLARPRFGERARHFRPVHTSEATRSP